MLYSNERLLPAGLVVDEAIRATFDLEFAVPVEFYIEFLDVDRFPGEIQQERTRDFLLNKYQERPPDVIIAGGGPALNFLTKRRAILFPRVPVVHCGVSPGNLPESMPDDRIVGIPHVVDMAATLELALRLQPDTRQVVVVGGYPFGKVEHSSLAGKVTFQWLTNRSPAQLRGELSRLPDKTIVFYGTLFRDPVGNAFTPRAALDQFAKASRVPIYSYYDTYLGHGIVGGAMVSFKTIGDSAAQIAIRILQGLKPQEAARGVVHTLTPMFDWQQLQRWKLDEAKLPPESIVLFRQPTLWDEHKSAILGGVALLLIEAALIAVLILQLRRRKRAEAVARESEQAARELSGRLIHTQEEERRRVARDLHDDFNQRLALLSVELDLLGRKSPRTDSAAKLQQLGGQVRDLSSDVHRLAYKLHPAKLDQLGLATAVGGLCRDLSQKSGVKMEFTPENVPRDLPADIAGCLFRVAQESLWNVVRHSEAKAARVELAVRDGHIRLTVSDAGKGFDLEAARKAGGLGLLSMRERVRLSGGDLKIRSKPGQGTQAELTIPLGKGNTVA